jgi:hypothetical protein
MLLKDVKSHHFLGLNQGLSQNRATLSYHPFYEIFHDKSSSYWGTSILSMAISGT